VGVNLVAFMSRQKAYCVLTLSGMLAWRHLIGLGSRDRAHGLRFTNERGGFDTPAGQGAETPLRCIAAILRRLA